MLDNAERHAASRITVGSHESADMAVLTVSDDGPRIAPEHAEPVFQRLGRIDTARSASTGGTRLGLAITREIVRRHGGSIALIATEPPGATFELRISLAA